MRPIDEAHVAEPGLVVVEVAAAGDETAFAFQKALAARWATTTADRTTREAGAPGVRLRCFVELRQELDSEHRAEENPGPATGRPAMDAVSAGRVGLWSGVPRVQPRPRPCPHRPRQPLGQPTAWRAWARDVDAAEADAHPLDTPPRSRMG